MSLRDALPVNRRAALAGLAATPLAGCAMPVASPLGMNGSPAPADSIDAAARLSGRRFGSSVAYRADGSGMSVTNPAYAAVIKAECGIVVPENELKWQYTRPGPDTYDFSAMDEIVRWAQGNDIAVRAHTLLWHRPQWFPEWLNNYDYGANPVQEAERLLTEHIRTATDRYRGVITSWDVVNEAIDHDRNTTIETSMSRAMGSPEAVLDLAFHTARDQLPDAELVYNDYMSWEPDHITGNKHVPDVLRLLEGFRKRGTPVDTLGIQSHIEAFAIDPATGLGPYMEREWRTFLDEVTGMGYKLIITEFDVKDREFPADIATRDRLVAEYTQRYMDVMLDYTELTDILAWGMVDRFNWLQYFDPAKRADGLEVRGTPYASDFTPKPLRNALRQSFLDAA